MSISFTVVASQNESCYNEYNIKLSTIFAHHQELKIKRNQAEELKSSLNATLVEVEQIHASLNAKLVEADKLDTSLITAQEEVDEMESLINNLTTEVKELHTTCDSALAMDCCQVKVLLNILLTLLSYKVKCLFADKGTISISGNWAL